MYEGDDMDLIKYYKRANCREVDIDFLGVWLVLFPSKGRN